MEEVVVPPISQLYYRYKKTEDDKIREYLKKIKLVTLQNKGAGTIQGYYPMAQEDLNKVLTGPRHTSLTFDAKQTQDEPLTGLVPYKKIVFLVQCPSRFYVKPDVGEIFDQIDWMDLLDRKVDAICMHSDFSTLEGTDGEHHLMSATLLQKA